MGLIAFYFKLFIFLQHFLLPSSSSSLLLLQSIIAFSDASAPEVVAQRLTSSSVTSPTSSPKNLTRGSSQDEYQYYIIGVYVFFATLFVIGLTMIVARKIRKACCPTTSRRYDDYDGVSQTDSLNPLDNPNFEYHVNVDYFDVESSAHQGNDSDFDNYSDDGKNAESNCLKDKPPAYEDPPSYSVVIQT